MPTPHMTSFGVRPLRWIAIATVLTALSGSTTAFGQSPRGATETPKTQQQQEAESAQINRAASDLLVRTFLRRSRNLSEASVADYRLTALGLHLARLVVPDDAELLRNEIEAWTAADDAARVGNATRELIRLDPRDTIAQLRLIDSQIGRLNTVEERRAAYDRLLGPAGEKIRGTIRSRLALDAALLAREDGDEQEYFRLLAEATLLDSTNKNAAALYASSLLPVAQTRVERFELIANVLLADPLDPGAYENAAIELMSGGAYESSLRFMDRMRDILGAGGIDFMSRGFLTDGRYFQEGRVNDYLIATWQHRGVADAISFINDAQGSVENQFAAEIRQLQEQGLPPAQLQQALSQRRYPWLPYQLERMRVLMLVAASEDEREQLAFTSRPLTRDRFVNSQDPFSLEGYIPPAPVTEQLRRSVAAEFPDATPEAINQTAQQRVVLARQINPLHEALTRFLLANRDLTEQLQQNQQVDARTKSIIELNMALESVWLLLVSEVSVDQAESRFDALLEALDDDALEQSAVDRYRGWIAANRGDFETAREKLTPIAETDASAFYALAMTELRSGNTDEAVRLFERLRVRFPQTALACIARDRITQIRSALPSPPVGSDEVNRYAMRFAPWLERITRTPREFMSLAVYPTKTTLGMLDRHELVLELSNTSGRPIAVGPNSPINSRFLFTPRVEITGKAYLDIMRERMIERAREQYRIEPNAPLPDEVRDQIEPIIAQQIGLISRSTLEVVDADRVLRLEPNETLRVPVWIGRGNAGQLLDRASDERLTIIWSVAQGFIQTQRIGSGGRPIQGFDSGPMSLSTQTEAVLKLKLSSLSNELLAERLSNSAGIELAQTLIRAATALSKSPDVDSNSVIRDALLERAPTLDNPMLSLLLLRLSELGQISRDDALRVALRDIVRERLNRIDLSTPDAQLLAAASMVTLSRAADERIIDRCRNSSVEDLAEFAAVFAEVLVAGGFATENTAAPTAPVPGEENQDPAFEIDDELLSAPGK